MEYVPGRDLRTVLQEGGMLSVEQAVEVGLQVCAAVGYAHLHQEQQKALVEAAFAKLKGFILTK